MSTSTSLKTAILSSEVKELKIKIKKWEACFTQEHGRRPTKSDIGTAAPEAVRKSYKQYWKLSQKSTQFDHLEAQNETWSAKFNKSTLIESGKYSGKSKDHREHNVVKNCINKLRAQALLSSNVFPKLPENPNKIPKQDKNSIVNSNIHPKENATILETENSEMFQLVVDNTIGLLKVPSKCVRIRNKALRNNTIHTSNAFLTQGKPTGTKTKVDIDWLTRCSEDLTLSGSGHSRKTETTSPETAQEAVFETRNCTSAVHDEMSSLESTDCVSLQKRISQDGTGNVEESDVFVETPQRLDDRVVNNEKSKEFRVKHLLENEALYVSASGNDVDNGILPQTKNSEQSNANCSNLSFDVSDDAFTRNENGMQANMRDSGKKPPIHDGHSTSTQCKRRKRKSSDRIEPACSAGEIGTIKKLKQHCSRRNEIKDSDKPFGAKKPRQNFVKLNLKKKVFVRGKRNFSYKKYKRDKWKNYQKNRDRNYSQSETSLQKSACRKEVWGSDDLTTDGKLMDDENDNLQTLEEATMAVSKEAGTSRPQTKSADVDDDSENLPSSTASQTSISNSASIEPLYKQESGKVPPTPRDVFNALKSMGFERFRPGQEEAIMRILCGLSALVVLPTGTGKSLCYQLPAFMYGQMYRCISLVISPLVSLMEDQVANVPSCLRAACWHSGLPEAQKKETLEKLESGDFNILLISPETLVGGSGYLFDRLPPLAFVCIDEAHCLSEWSHNFRPSYLQLIKVLSTKMGVQRILALTATASKATTVSIACHLGLTGEEGAVIEITGIPDNLLLSVSRDEFRDEALVQLLRGDRFGECESIIIYCTRREETERVSSTIRICMQGEETSINKGKKGKKWLVDAYHSGLTAAKRKSVQKRFMNGSLRIVVATVAFGMGLNKMDVRGIIHYNMPKTFEHYVQEIGRAGRDGLPAHCHLFLNVDGKDLPELRRHVYSNGVDRHVIRKLLLLLFKRCRCFELQEEVLQCPCHEIAIPIGSVVNELDVKEENIATLICYLESLPEKWVQLLQPVYANCTIRCYKGQTQLQGLVKSCPAVAVAFALARKRGERPENKTQLQFDVVSVASHMGWNSGVVKKQLKQLEWENGCGRWKKTGVMVEFSDLAFHLKTPGNLSDDQKDHLLDYLHDKVRSMEKRELSRIAEVESTFRKVSHAKFSACCDEVDLGKSTVLKDEVMKYYDRPIPEFEEIAEEMPSKNSLAEIGNARKDIIAMLEVHHDNNFTGRAVARIFHGIGSPCYPVEVWGRVRRFWRSHLHVDFYLLMTLANEEIRKMR